MSISSALMSAASASASASAKARGASIASGTSAGGYTDGTGDSFLADIPDALSDSQWESFDVADLNGSDLRLNEKYHGNPCSRLMPLTEKLTSGGR